MDKLTKSLFVMVIFLVANLSITEGARHILMKEDEIMYGSKGLLPPPPLWWLKVWWLTHGWLKPFPPFLGIGPLAEVAKLKSIVGLLEKKITFDLANIPEVDVEAIDGPLH